MVACLHWVVWWWWCVWGFARGREGGRGDWLGVALDLCPFTVPVAGGSVAKLQGASQY